jgi:hypothetical protein
MIPTRWIVAATLPFVMAGCGGSSKIDASSDSALVASINKINSSLDPDGRKQFADDCSAVIFPDALKVAAQSEIRRERGRVPASARLYKPLHGFTVSQVHDKAGDARRQAEQARASESPASGKDTFASTIPFQAEPSVKPDPPAVVNAPASVPADPPADVAKVKPPDPTWIPDPTWVAKSGARGMLLAASGNKVFVCKDLFAWGEFLGWSAAKSDPNFAYLVKNGHVSEAEHGTAVLITGRHDDPSVSKGVPVVQVQMIDGKLAGRSGWVAVTTVASLVEPQVAAARQKAAAEEERRVAEAKAGAGNKTRVPGGAGGVAQAPGGDGPMSPTQQAADRKAWEAKVAEVYPTAKKALSDAKNRAAQAPLSARKAALKRETEEAAESLCSAYGLTRQELDRVMLDGKVFDDRSKKAVSGRK